MSLSVPTLEVDTWTNFKATCLAGKKLLMQFVEWTDRYDIYATDSLVWHIVIYKGTADATDFENNYKANANKRSNLSVVMVDREGTEIALPVGEAAPLSAALFGGVDSAGFVQALRFEGVRLKTNAVLTDGTNEAVITPDGRLNVTMAQNSLGAVFELLKNGSSSEMAVDASGTPQVFEWNPGAHDVVGDGLMFIIEDATIYFGDKFAGISALANGVLIEMKASDVVHTAPVLYRTRDLAQIASPGGFDVYSATPDSLRAQLGIGGCTFKASGTYATEDYVRVTVRDNLTGLNHMSVMFKGVEV